MRLMSATEVNKIPLVEGWDDEIVLHEVKAPLLSLRGLLEVLHLRKRAQIDSEGRTVREDNGLSLRFDGDGGPYTVPPQFGKVGMLSRIEHNWRRGRPLGESLPLDPFNDPEA